MPSVDCLRSVAVRRSARVLQVEGMFDVAPSPVSERRWRFDLPLEGWEWNVGLIVGPSGSGKSTVAREAFGGSLVAGYDWPGDASVLDGFPAGMGVKEVTGLLSSVGFSSPPSWLRPFACLSNGEQFRVTLARAMAESPELAVIDEFTSVVDRTVAQVGSAAVAKAVRRSGRKLVAVSCHHDILDWLDPDWVLEMPDGVFTRRSLRGRPKIDLEVRRVHPAAWELFKRHHYMSADHHKGAYCFAASWRGRPVAYCSVLHFPHAKRPGWREHRTVCLPDFQGVGVGNALSEYVASLFAATGKPYRGTTSHPGLSAHRHRSPSWKCIRDMSLQKRLSRSSGVAHTGDTLSTSRLTSSFEFVGDPRRDEAVKFALPVK